MSTFARAPSTSSSSSTTAAAESLGSRRDVKLLALAREYQHGGAPCDVLVVLVISRAGLKPRRQYRSTYSFAQDRQVVHRPAMGGLAEERGTIKAQYAVSSCLCSYRHLARPRSSCATSRQSASARKWTWSAADSRTTSSGHASRRRVNEWIIKRCPISSQHSWLGIRTSRQARSLTHSLGLIPRASWVVQRCCGWLERDTRHLSLCSTAEH